MTLPRVRAWRDALRADVDRAPDTGLSRAGLRLVLDDALGALDDDSLAIAVARGGRPYERATFVAARTVVTAPIEWLAVLLARGTAVTLKHPAGGAGLATWLRAHAAALGLPLHVTDDRDAVRGTPLVIAMGDDDTVAAVHAAADRDARVLGFGHRVSLAWWPVEAPVQADAAAIARDLAAHDGRGCMTPSVVLTTQPDCAVDALATAMPAAERSWPRGEVAPAEHAALRARTALARVTGRVVEGAGWAIHRLPAAHASPVSLPRAAQVVGVGSVDEAHALAVGWGLRLSTVGVPGAGLGMPGGAFERDVARICALGDMQRPELLRTHELGLDHWAATGLGA